MLRNWNSVISEKKKTDNVSQESKIEQNTIGLQQRESWSIEKLSPTLQFCLLLNLESQVQVHATQNPLGPWILLQAILAASVAESETYSP